MVYREGFGKSFLPFALLLRHQHQRGRIRVHEIINGSSHSDKEGVVAEFNMVVQQRLDFFNSAGRTVEIIITTLSCPWDSISLAKSWIPDLSQS